MERALRKAVVILLREQLQKWYYDRETKIQGKELETTLAGEINQQLGAISSKIRMAEELIQQLEP